MKIALFVSFLVLSCTSFAGVKEDFTDAVVKQCKKSLSEAETLATPGRAGNIIKFSVCTSGQLDVGGGCLLTCSDKSSSIGG